MHPLSQDVNSKVLDNLISVNANRDKRNAVYSYPLYQRKLMLCFLKVGVFLRGLTS